MPLCEAISGTPRLARRPTSISRIRRSYPHLRTLSSAGRSRQRPFSNAVAPSNCVAAVHHQGLPGDEGRCIGSEEVDCQSDVLGGTEATQRQGLLCRCYEAIVEIALGE